MMMRARDGAHNNVLICGRMTILNLEILIYDTSNAILFIIRHDVLITRAPYMLFYGQLS